MRTSKTSSGGRQTLPMAIRLIGTSQSCVAWKVCLLPAFLAACAVGSPQPGRAERVFPGKTWESKTPAEAGLNDAKLDEAAEFLDGRGCIIRGGYVVKTWGDQTELSDWF